MTKKFKKKRKFKITFIWYVLFVFLVYELVTYFFSLPKLASSNEEFVISLLEDSNYHINYEKNNKNIFTKIFTYAFNTNNPFKIIKNNLYQESNSPNFILNESESSLVYIYNTHNSEEYLKGYLEGYNIDPNIMMAASLLSDKLNGMGISTIVEENKVSDYLDKNNMNFYQSYTVSREYLKETLKTYPDLKLIIDLHRDSLSREDTFVTINDKNYAKVLFVVGQKYETYKDNLSLSNKINDLIKTSYPTLTRGIMMKNGKEQNGIYNQDVNSNVILLELGSNNNTIDEVYNTIEILAPILKEAINEN